MLKATICSLDSVWEKKHSRDFNCIAGEEGSRTLYAHMSGNPGRNDRQWKTGYKTPWATKQDSKNIQQWELLTIFMNVVKKKKKKAQGQTLSHPLLSFMNAFISHLSTFLGSIYLEQSNKGCLIQSFLKFSSGKNLSPEEIIFNLSNDRTLITLWISLFAFHKVS